jgi:hypothetical protein
MSCISWIFENTSAGVFPLEFCSASNPFLFNIDYQRSSCLHYEQGDRVNRSSSAHRKYRIIMIGQSLHLHMHSDDS